MRTTLDAGFICSLLNILTSVLIALYRCGLRRARCPNMMGAAGFVEYRIEESLEHGPGGRAAAGSVS